MAKLSNINGKFAVEDTGAIRFSDQTGTTGQILKSNGNSAPTWVDPNTVGTGPWLPLAGGVVSGPTTFQSSLTVGGLLTGANATFNGLMKLDAGGILQFAANTATPSMGVAIHRSAADTLNFVTASTNRLTIDGSGKVTFGPDAQDIQIDPASTNSGNNLIYMRGNASDDKSSLQMNHFGYADYYIGVGHVGNGKFNIANDLTGNDFVIDTSGNVGIGTDSPNYQLEVRTTTNNRAIQAVNSTTSGTNWGFQGGAFGVGASKNIGLQINVEGASTNYAALLIGGNVGIETATPQKKLHIEGTGGASEMQILVSSASDTVGHTAGIGLRGEGGEADGDLRIKGGIFFERISGSFGNGKMILAVNSSVNNNSVTVADHALTIDTNKNVGIGTASPTGYRLVVENTSEDLLKLHNSTDGLDALISFTNPGGTLGRIQGIDNGGLGFDTGNNAGGINTNAMFIKNDGNVGIGTTSPQAKLDIGDGDFKQLKIIGANRLCVFRFQNAQSSFNNPDIVLFSNTTATGSYPQVSVHIKMHGRGFSANYSQFTEALATVELSTALIGLRSSIINHTTLGSAVSAGTFSISGTSLRFTPNRQTNYDTFSIEVNINSISVTYNT